MRDSVVGASVRASSLFWEPTFVALWISSMTTASQRTFCSCARYLGDFRVSIETMTRGKYVNGFFDAGSFCRTRWIPWLSRRTRGIAKRPQLLLELLHDVSG